MVALIYPVAVVGRVPPLVTVLPPPSVMAPLPELSRVGTQAIRSLLDGEKREFSDAVNQRVKWRIVRIAENRHLEVGESAIC